MADRAIRAIEVQAGNDVTFAWFRSVFMADHDLRASLKYGHAVIDSVAQLDQYLYTYGPMIESQWQSVAPYLGHVGRPRRWIDYGCGQGLAGLLANDLTHGSLFGDLREIILIEPSGVALARAAAIYAAIAPWASITCIAKRFDDVAEADLPASDGDETVHVFSNTLDVPGYNPLRLLSLTLAPGWHTILSVSHDRDFNGGTPQLEGVKAALEGFGASIAVSTLDHFTCNNPRQSEGVVWLCRLEVDDG